MSDPGDFPAGDRKAVHPLPNARARSNLGWPLFGPGLKNLGRAGRPAPLPLPETGEDRLLVRVDAVGLCYSDIKLINLGAAHPRIYGRNLRDNPVIPGHEAVVTVVGVGARLQDRFRVGERYVVQSEVYYQGKPMTFGYTLPGALQQYTAIGREILDGDEGCYLLPVREPCGYAEAALSEPWACVAASYRITRRETLQPAGTAWFIAAGEKETGGYTLEGAFSPQGGPGKIVVSGRPGRLRDRLARESGAVVVEEEKEEAGELSRRHTGGRGFDDIVFFGVPSPQMVENAAAVLAAGGVLAVLAETPVKGKIAVDIGRIHYDRHHFTGAATKSLAKAYRLPRPMALKPGGRAWFIGAGGPMGQMHIQRAVETPGGPGLILATDINDRRLAELRKRFAPAADRRGVRLVTLNPRRVSRRAFAAGLQKETGGELFDDLVVLAPVPAVIAEGARWLGRDGVLNIFAGLPRGVTAKLEISGVYLAGHRWTGSSGSSLSDLRGILEQIHQGRPAPNCSVAAVGGLAAAAEGLRAVRDRRFPGKIIIWPQLTSLPLIPLPELRRRLPQVALKLTPGGLWTTAAEAELFRSRV